MREHLTFICEESLLVGTLDRGSRSTGLLILTGGTQTRTGPHRMMAELAAQTSAAGFPTFRFDRRGCGDSEGIDPGFGNSEPDMAAAMLAFQNAAPSLRSIVGLGLCDGATALMLHHKAIGASRLILLNPWLIEVEPNQLPPAAIRRHYAKRLFTRSGWRHSFQQGFHPLKAAQGLKRAYGQADTSLAERCAVSLRLFAGNLNILLAEGDGTAQGFEDAWAASRFDETRERAKVSRRATSSHSFARIADQSWLTSTVLSILGEADQSADPS